LFSVVLETPPLALEPSLLPCAAPLSDMTLVVEVSEEEGSASSPEQATLRMQRTHFSTVACVRERCCIEPV
jgi:hypothetical protein